jgi:hypothetical protein
METGLDNIDVRQSNDPTGGQSWPVFSTPLRYFLWVFVPVALLMGGLMAFSTRAGIRVSAGVVVGCSLYAGCRGYLCRVHVDARGVAYRTPRRSVRLEWDAVRLIGRYAPGPGAASYVFITSRESPPAGRWDVDERTIQLQDRPGLLESLEAARRAAAKSPPDA